MRANRSFRPTFVATIVPGEENEHAQTAKGQPYSTLRDVTVIRDGRPDVRRTVMAFGPASELARRLIPGKPVILAVQHDDGVMRIVGEPRATSSSL